MSESTLSYCQIADRRYEADTSAESECPYCRALAAEARAAQLEAERVELIEWRDAGEVEIEQLTAERDEAMRQLEQAREASLELGRTLQFTRIGWDDTVTCEGVLDPINKIAFKIGEALGIDGHH